MLSIHAVLKVERVKLDAIVGVDEAWVWVWVCYRCTVFPVHQLAHDCLRRSTHTPRSVYLGAVIIVLGGGIGTDIWTFYQAQHLLKRTACYEKRDEQGAASANPSLKRGLFLVCQTYWSSKCVQISEFALASH